jgi:hypothetical protein
VMHAAIAVALETCVHIVRHRRCGRRIYLGPHGCLCLCAAAVLQGASLPPAAHEKTGKRTRCISERSRPHASLAAAELPLDTHQRAVTPPPALRLHPRLNDSPGDPNVPSPPPPHAIHSCAKTVCNAPLQDTPVAEAAPSTAVDTPASLREKRVNAPLVGRARPRCTAVTRGASGGLLCRCFCATLLRGRAGSWRRHGGDPPLLLGRTGCCLTIIIGFTALPLDALRIFAA